MEADEVAASIGAGRAVATRPRLFSPPFVLTCLSTFAYYLSHLMSLIATPLYALHLGGTEADAGTLTLLFILSALIARLPTGWAMDRWGRRPVLLAGTGIALLSTAIYPALGRAEALFPLRTLHGAGIGLFSTASAAMITDLAPLQRRGEGMGYFGISSNLGLALGPPVALAVMGRWGFATLFSLAAVVALAALVLGGLAGETVAPRPVAFSLRPRALFALRVALPGLVMGAMTISYGGLITLLPLMGRARPLGNPGAFFTAAAVMLVLTRVLAGPLSDRWGRGIIIVPGLVVEAASMIMVGLAHGPALLAAAGAVYGTGFALAQTALMALAADRAGPADRARAMSTYFTGWELGIGIGGYGLALCLPRAGFTGAFALAALASIAGVVGYLAARGRPPLISRPGA